MTALIIGAWFVGAISWCIVDYRRFVKSSFSCDKSRVSGARRAERSGRRPYDWEVDGI